MASPAYSRDYRDWLAQGNFESVYEHGRENLEHAIESQRPDLVAPGLRGVAHCYYTRGAVSLLDGERTGWHDIQCGYLASVYSIRFATPLLTGLDAALKDSPKSVIYAVMTLGLARLFAVEFDERLLRERLADCYDVGELTGKVRSGRHVLDSIYHRDHSLSIEALRQDRRECCQKRDAWPTRPTEFAPFGVVDVELALNSPDEAEFPYRAIAYLPTEDELVIRAMATYHQWND